MGMGAQRHLPYVHACSMLSLHMHYPVPAGEVILFGRAGRWRGWPFTVSKMLKFPICARLLSIFLKNILTTIMASFLSRVLLSADKVGKKISQIKPAPLPFFLCHADAGKRTLEPSMRRPLQALQFQAPSFFSQKYCDASTSAL